MKIRNGFVSNSSSSSFIIKDMDINEVATHMLNTIVEDFSDWRENNKVLATYKKWKENLKEILKNPEVKDGDIGITMPSCNYRTYIVIKDGEIYVQTANNHTWNFTARDVDYDSDRDKVFGFMGKIEYKNVENKMVHSMEKWVDVKKVKNCPKCKQELYDYFEIKDGKKTRKICAHCYKDIK